KGFFQREIARSAYLYQKAVEEKRKTVVGVNEFVHEEPPSIEILKIDPSVERAQIEKLRSLRKERNGVRVKETLKQLREAAETGQNLMPRILNCVKVYVTIGEMVDLLKEEFGEYREPPIFW
ncbi:methylmalonyl-CoA mutase, partial [candidate division TA06 bacterium DG_26]